MSADENRSVERRPVAHPQIEKRSINLVLEGGGVKAVAHVGALMVLEEHNFVFERLVGASAGAVVAALAAADIPATKLKGILDALNLPDLKVKLWGRFTPRRIGKVKSLLVHGAMYDMSYLRSWLDGLLRGQNVVTFGDLTVGGRDRLTVAVTDLTRGEVVYLPRDYPRLYGRDPNRQKVVDAVCASAAFPFFFRPPTIEAHTEGMSLEDRVPQAVSTLIDGGMVANYPIDVFEGRDGTTPPIPTLGIKLLTRLPRPAGDDTVFPTPQTHTIPGRLAEMMIGTMVAGRMQAQLDLGETPVSTVYVDTSCVDILHFEMTEDQRRTLFDNGRSATEEFLESWPPAAGSSGAPASRASSS